jgi:hypothetical protein
MLYLTILYYHNSIKPLLILYNWLAITHDVNNVHGNELSVIHIYCSFVIA